MGESKRRKQLDPNYGKIPIPPEHLVKSWLDGQPLVFFPSQASIDVNEDLIKSGTEHLKSFQLVKKWTKSIDDQIRQRYSQMGQGFVSLVPSEIMMASLGESTRSPIEWNYWSRSELIALDSRSLLLGKIKTLKPFLLWAIDNYQPSTEAILVLCGFPVSIDKAASGITVEELATNRFYGVLRYQFSPDLLQ